MSIDQEPVDETRFLVVSSHIAIPRDELHFTFVRSSGPGGQNVNKVNSKAVLRFSIRETKALPDEVKSRFLQRYKSRVSQKGDILVVSQRYRDQGRNVLDCEEKLREMLQIAATPVTIRKKSKPSRGARAARLNQKRATSQKKVLRRPPGPE